MRHAFVLLVLPLASLVLSLESQAEPAEAPPAIEAAEPALVIELDGKVGWTHDVMGYTYLRVDTEKGPIFVAVPRTTVREGDVVHVSDAAPMDQFYSPTLDRRFDRIYFASAIVVEGGASSTVRSMPELHQATTDPGEAIDAAGVSPLPNGPSIADVRARAETLAGERISVRGRVTKFVPNVMGRNWIHLRDASVADARLQDLAVTTADTTSPGKTIRVTGRVAARQDFGYGYTYDVLIEDASVESE